LKLDFGDRFTTYSSLSAYLFPARGLKLEQVFELLYWWYTFRLPIPRKGIETYASGMDQQRFNFPLTYSPQGD